LVKISLIATGTSLLTFLLILLLLNKHHDRKNQAEKDFYEIIEGAQALFIGFDTINTLNREEINRLNELVANQTIEKKSIERALAQLQSQASENHTTQDNIFLAQASFYDVATKIINHAKRHHQILAFLTISLEPHQEISALLDSQNEIFVSNEIGKRLSHILRTDDVIAKTNDYEFTILLNDIKQAKFASTVSEKLLEQCTKSIKINTREFPFKTSIGISVYPNDGSDLNDMLNNADHALIQAKKDQRQHYQFFSEELDTLAKEFMLLESLFKKAIKNNELELFYQPKLRLKTGKITGVEALMRWEHATLGKVTPNQFIQLAEETGLSMPICEWALTEACKKNKYWQEEGYEHLTVSVNLSHNQFLHPTLAQVVQSALSRSGLHPQYLELEIAENVIMDQPHASKTILDSLKNIGVQVSIDHFGTGYTSISCLKQYPINLLKIDQSFIKGLPQQPDDIAITNAFISLAHHLGMEVVAEGVETVEQVQYLSQQNCDIIQGFYLGHPVNAEGLAKQLKKIKEGVLF